MRRLWGPVVAALVGSVTAVADGGPISAALPTSSVTVESGVLNTAITGGLISPLPTLSVADSGRVADVDVGVRIDHTFDGDLDILLESPDGTMVDLSSDNGADGDGYGIDANCTATAGLTVFDDSAATAITAGTAPYVGSFVPEEPLSVLENESSAGTWSLWVLDDTVALDDGTFVCWTLTVTYTGPLSAADACSQLAWSGSDAGATRQIWVANADGQGRTEISTVAPDPDPIENWEPVWSPDGSRVAWQGSDGADDQIWVANADGTNRVKISDVSVGADPTGNFEPTWSPDGTRIAWAGNDGVTEQIWVADADGTNRVNVSDASAGIDPTGNFGPVWSPDGTRIAWAGFDGVTDRIWVADSDGTNRVEISTTGAGPDPIHNQYPAWAIDGTQIAWAGSDGATVRIWVANADGTNRIQISSVGADPDPTSNFSPVWSPDGSAIAWFGFDGATDQIWVADPDGSDRMRISDVSAGVDPTGSRDPAWSPDGSRITWTGSDGADNQIYVSDPDGTDREEISSVELGADPTFNRYPYWRGWNSELGLSIATATGLEAAQMTAWTATVTNTGPCPSASVVVSGLGLPCVAASVVSVTAGSVAGSTWTIPDLAAGASATATVSGTVTSAGACSSTLSLTAAPVTASPVSAVLGGDADCPSPGMVVPFTDLGTASVSHRDDIVCLYELGVTTGTSATTYSPLGDVTRQQMASFLARLYRAMTGTDAPVVAVPFIDVGTASVSHRDDIARIYGLGITTGTSPTTYTPLDNVTRQQMASFLARLYASATETAAPVVVVPFTDMGMASVSHRDDIARIYGLGITTGTSPTTYTPLDNVTRQQMASFLARLYRAA